MRGVCGGGALTDHIVAQKNEPVLTSMLMLSEGVRSSWAGQQHIPRERDQAPPSCSTILRARFSSCRPWNWDDRCWCMGHLHRNVPPPAQPPLCIADVSFSYIRCSIYVLSRFDHQRIRE